MSDVVAQRSRDAVALLAVVEDAQAKLTQLEATARGLIEELAASGAQATPRLRELLASGERLVAAVTAAGGKLAPHLPSGNALPGAPDRVAVDAVWARELQPQAEGAAAATATTPVVRPAATLQALASTLAALPGCHLVLLRGRSPAGKPEEASTVLLHCGRAFAAAVHLQSPGGLLPLRVGVMSTAEAAAATAAGSGDPLSGSSVSLWAPSRHAVFQQLSAQAAAALEHFLQQSSNCGGGAAASALELLLLWLATCGDVFTRRAAASDALLLADPAAGGAGLLPPLRRPYEGLGWEALWAAALNPQLRSAEHLATELA